jgi:hypothetical protein
MVQQVVSRQVLVLVERVLIQSGLLKTRPQNRQRDCVGALGSDRLVRQERLQLPKGLHPAQKMGLRQGLLQEASKLQ